MEDNKKNWLLSQPCINIGAAIIYLIVFGHFYLVLQEGALAYFSNPFLSLDFGSAEIMVIAVAGYLGWIIFRDIKKQKFLTLTELASIVGLILSVIVLVIMNNGLSPTNTPNNQLWQLGMILLLLNGIIQLGIVVLGGISLYTKKQFILSASNIKVAFTKHWKIISGVSGVLAVTFIVITYITIFYKPTVDVFEYLDVQFQGVSGSGEVNWAVNHTEDAKITAFLDELSFNTDVSDNLSNGDTITISIDNPDSGVFNIESMTKSYTVENLLLVPENPDGIKIISDLDKEMRATVEGKYNYYGDMKAEVVAVCYTTTPKVESQSYSAPDLAYGTVMNLYKVTYTQTSWTSNKSTVTKFYGAGVTNLLIDSDGNLVSETEKWNSGYSGFDNYTDLKETAESYGLNCGD